MDGTGITYNDSSGTLNILVGTGDDVQFRDTSGDLTVNGTTTYSNFKCSRQHGFQQGS